MSGEWQEEAVSESGLVDEVDEVDSDDLSQFDEEWGTLKSKREEVVDGTYQVYVSKVEFAKDKNKVWVLSWQLKILKGDMAGRVVFMRNYTKTPENREWLKITLATCGVELQKFSEIRDRLGELLDIPLEIKKVTKAAKNGKGEMQDFSNVFIQKKLDIELERNEDGSIKVEGEEGTPF